MGRQRIALVVLGIGAWFWLRDGSRPAPSRVTPPSLQAAVLSDGFAVLELRDAPNVSELDRDGRVRRRTSLAITGDTRVVGSRVGVTLGYLRRDQLELAFIDKHGAVKPSQRFGKRVAKICDGAATDDSRFALGWMESDGGLWLVHGPVGATVTELPQFAASATSGWCGMRSAGAYVALMWLDGVTVKVLMCSERECARFVTPMKIERGAKLLDVACQEAGCVVVTQTSGAPMNITAYDLRGKKKWSRAWPHVETHAGVHLVAAGRGAFVVAAATSEVTFADRILAKTGGSQREWVAAPTTTVPVLAWARGQLLLTYRDHGRGELQHRLLALPE